MYELGLAASLSDRFDAGEECLDSAASCITCGDVSLSENRVSDLELAIFAA